MILFLARKNGQLIGRIAGIIDRHYVEFHHENLGFFGFFESIRDPEVADLLLSAVRDWLNGHGMEKMAGPMNPSTNDECALLVEGFDSPPVLMMTYNPHLLRFPSGRMGIEKGHGSVRLLSLRIHVSPRSPD